MNALLQEPATRRRWPCAEVHKHAADICIDVETPGFEADDLEVEVEGHKLIVLGKPERGHDGAAFDFTFELPADTDLERLRAAFEGGVLTVKGPFLPEAGERRLEIEHAHLGNPRATGS